MKRMTVIWIIYVLGILGAFVLSSCSGSHPKYVAKSGVIKVPIENKKRKTVMQVHIAAIIWTGIIFHLVNEKK